MSLFIATWVDLFSNPRTKAVVVKTVQHFAAPMEGELDTISDHPLTLRPNSMLRSGSFLSLRSINISIIGSDCGSEYLFHPEDTDRSGRETPNYELFHTHCKSSHSFAEERGKVDNLRNRIEKMLKDMEVLLVNLADRLRHGSLIEDVRQKGPVVDGTAVLADVSANTGITPFHHNLISDEHDAANFVHANVRLLKVLRNKVDVVIRLEEELKRKLDTVEKNYNSSIIKEERKEDDHFEVPDV